MTQYSEPKKAGGTDCIYCKTGPQIWEPQIPTVTGLSSRCPHLCPIDTVSQTHVHVCTHVHTHTEGK